MRAYLSRFGSAEQTRFAIFKIGGAVLAEQMQEIASSLSLLNSVGLTPLVVHGAGPQLDRLVSEAGIDAGKVGGLRVTTPDIMKMVAKTTMQLSVQLAAAITRSGGAAAPVPPTAIRAKVLDESVYGLVGDPEAVAHDEIAELAMAGSVPIIGCVGYDEHGRVVNINADAVARALALAFEPLKIVFVTGTGGLRDADGDLITSINLESEIDALKAEGTVYGGMLVKLEEIAKLLLPLPRSSSVSITSASGLVRELFTHGGAGTLVRRGEAITRHETLDTIDWPRLRRLIEGAFGRTLHDDYLERIDFVDAFVSEDYRAAAVMMRVKGQIVLDKFVVDKAARGAGLSHALWRLMTEVHPLVFWRSRRSNGFNAFYNEQADGFTRADPWHIYWCGETDLATAEPIVNALATHKPSFVEDAQ